MSFSASPTDLFYRDKAEVFKSLSRATVAMVPEFWRSPSATPLLNLSVSLRKVDPETAVAVAEGAVQGDQGNPHLRSRLSQTLREVVPPDPYAAEATCRDFFAKHPQKLRDPIRPLVLEWAVASGACTDLSDHGARNVWLALLFVSDQAGGKSVLPSHAKHLPAVTKGLTHLNCALPNDVAARAAAAVLAAGRVIPGTLHLDTAEMLAGELATRTSVDDLGDALSALAQAAWTATDESFKDQLCLSSLGTLTFNALGRVVGEAHLESRQGLRRKKRGRNRRR
jgi:hypothetical protein